MENSHARTGTAFLFALLACCFLQVPAVAGPNGKIVVGVSIPPQAFFAEQVGGDRVSVHVLLLPGRSPATFAPTPAQVSKLAKSTLYFRVGMPFETALVSRIADSAGKLTIIDTRSGITLRRMDPGLHGHDEGQAAEAHHPGENEGYDPHIWLDPGLVKQQAATMRDALMAVDPEGGQFYKENYRRFAAALDSLDERIRQVLAPVRGSTLFVFHPSFGYFAAAYGLHQSAVEVEGKAPKGKDLSAFIKKARQENVRIIFVQPQFDKRTAEKIAATIDGAVIPLDPLARDYIKNLETMALTVAAALN